MSFLRKIFFALAACLLWHPAFSAALKTTDEIAPVAGVGLTFPNYQVSRSFSEMKKEISFHGGAIYTHNFTQILGARGGLMYLQESTTSKRYDVKYNYKFLRIPALFKFKPVETLAIFVGINCDLLLSAKEDGDATFKEQYRTDIWSLSFVAEVNITEGFFAYVKYNRQLNDMYNKKYMYGYSGEKNSFKRNSIEIGVGYTFVLRSIDTRILRK